MTSSSSQDVGIGILSALLSEDILRYMDRKDSSLTIQCWLLVHWLQTPAGLEQESMLHRGRLISARARTQQNKCPSTYNGACALNRLFEPRRSLLRILDKTSAGLDRRRSAPFYSEGNL